MIKLIVKYVYRNYGVSIRALWKTYKFNGLDAIERNNAIIIAHPDSQLKIDEEGKMILNALLRLGESAFKTYGLKARILVNRGGIFAFVVNSQFTMAHLFTFVKEVS